MTVTTVCPGFVRTKMSTDIPYRHPVKMIEPEAGGPPPAPRDRSPAAQLRLSLGHENRPGDLEVHAGLVFRSAHVLVWPASAHDRILEQAGEEAMNQPAGLSRATSPSISDLARCLSCGQPLLGEERCLACGRAYPCATGSWKRSGRSPAAIESSPISTTVPAGSGSGHGNRPS